ncbi:MAG: hypothetical protein K1X55_16545 [Chitinophagales bacterium]|nr:hypothetical protein [Chitinophagales bacterium]
MNIENLNQLIHQIQKNETLHQEKILGVSLWSIIKSPLYEVLLRKLGNNEIENEVVKILKKNTILYSFKRLLKAKTILLFRKNSFYQKFDGIMFVNVMASHVQDGKITFNFSDVIISEQYNHQFLLIHNDKGHQFTNEFKHPPHFPSNPFKFPPTLFLSKKQKNRYLQQLQNLSLIINDTLKKDNFDEKITQHVIDNLFHNKVIKAIANFEKEYHRFKKFLQHYKPKFIYLTNSQSHQGIILASKEQHVPVIELQHGLITRDHRVYDWPRSYRNQLNVLPDYLFVWGKMWQEVFLKDENYWDESSIFAVGNPNFDIFRNNFQRNNIIIDKENNKNTILFTSNYIVAEELSKFLLNFLEQYYEIIKDKYQINIKFHPIEKPTEQYLLIEKKFNDIITFIDKKITFSEALQQSDALISTFSVTLFESVALNKTTALLNIMGSADIINKLPEFGIITINDKEELFSFLSSITVDKMCLNEDYLFKRNANININNKLKEIYG